MTHLKAGNFQRFSLQGFNHQRFDKWVRSSSSCCQTKNKKFRQDGAMHLHDRNAKCSNDKIHEKKFNNYPGKSWRMWAKLQQVATVREGNM